MKQLTLFAFLIATPVLGQLPNGVKEASVMIDAGDGWGSGVIFKNGDSSFIWTDAHVIDSTRKTKTAIDPKTGAPKVIVRYNDVSISQLVVKDGRKIGANHRLAQVIRHCDEEDIALLLVHEKSFGQSSVKFSTSIPKDGDDVWHIGSFHGTQGEGSVSKGTLAAVGRLRSDFRHTDTKNPLIYDQISVVAHRGSSGGGVFASGGECIGLVTEFLNANDGPTHGSLCITPSRRLLAFAKRTNVEFAVNSALKVPPLEAILSEPITVGTFPVPSDWPKPAALPSTSLSDFLRGFFKQ